MVDALVDSSIRFVTTRDERGAAFMADTYGALTGKPGVCLATLGPGAINLMLGIANAQLDSHPLVAITAQAGLGRIYKESHQFVDIVSLVPARHEVGRHGHAPGGGAGDDPQGVQAGHDRTAGRHVHRPARGRRGAAGRGHAAPRQRAAGSGALRGSGPPGRARPGVGGAPRGAGRPRHRPRRRRRRADPVLRAAERPGRDHVPGQRGVPRRPSERARHDRVHGPGLRELRVRPRRRRGGRRLRPGRVLTGALEPEPGQADRAHPPHGGRGRRALLARGRAPGVDRSDARRHRRVGGHARDRAARCLRCEAWCTRSSSAERRTTRSR